MEYKRPQRRRAAKGPVDARGGASRARDARSFPTAGGRVVAYVPRPLASRLGKLLGDGEGRSRVEIGAGSKAPESVGDSSPAD